MKHALQILFLAAGLVLLAAGDCADRLRTVATGIDGAIDAVAGDHNGSVGDIVDDIIDLF